MLELVEPTTNETDVGEDPSMLLFRLPLLLLLRLIPLPTLKVEYCVGGDADDDWLVLVPVTNRGVDSPLPVL